MALEFLWRPESKPARVAVFPGAWNPPTVAHLEIARTALSRVDEVIWTIPRQFPHKDFEWATFEQRCRMIRAMAASEPRFAAAVAEGGLYVDIAREAREAYGEHVEIDILCGRDAAERIQRWRYGRPGVFEDMIRDFRLVVAAREGEYASGVEHGGRILTLEMGCTFDDVSSSEVRRRMAAGEDWMPLVPRVIHDEVMRIAGR